MRSTRPVVLMRSTRPVLLPSVVLFNSSHQPASLCLQQIERLRPASRERELLQPLHPPAARDQPALLAAAEQPPQWRLRTTSLRQHIGTSGRTVPRESPTVVKCVVFRRRTLNRRQERRGEFLLDTHRRLARDRKCSCKQSWRTRRISPLHTFAIRRRTGG